MNDETERAQAIARLEELGEAQVRLLMLRDGLPASWNQIILRWLADKVEESERSAVAAAGKQAEIARSANEAAWAAARAAERASSAAERQAVAADRQAVAAERANIRATIALVIAIISIIATVIGIWIVHRDTAKVTSHSSYCLPY